MWILKCFFFWNQKKIITKKQNWTIPSLMYCNLVMQFVNLVNKKTSIQERLFVKFNKSKNWIEKIANRNWKLWTRPHCPNRMIHATRNALLELSKKEQKNILSKNHNWDMISGIEKNAHVIFLRTLAKKEIAKKKNQQRRKN